jgi:hypothetical protein
MAEKGIDKEAGRAAIWEVDPRTGRPRSGDNVVFVPFEGMPADSPVEVLTGSVSAGTYLRQTGHPSRARPRTIRRGYVHAHVARLHAQAVV